MALEAASRLDVMRIPLKSLGDGTGVSYITLKSDVNTTATISGTGRFYTDSSGTAGESTTSALSAGVVKKLYVKCTSGTCTVSIRHKSMINELGFVGGVTSFITEVSNGPVLNDFNVSTAISPNVRIIRLNCTNSSVSGELQAWPSVTYLYFSGSLISVSGELQAWPSVTYVLFIGSLILISYPTATTFQSSMRRVYINPKSGSMVSADVDRLLNQLKSVTSWNTEKEVYLAGRCGAHTSASDDAIAAIRALGCTVTVN